MPGILASGRRLEELISWKLKGNSRAIILDLSSERLVNFESYELVGEERAPSGQVKERFLEGRKKSTYNVSYPKVDAPLKIFPTILCVDLSHNFLKSFGSLLYILPNAWWINLSFNGIEVLPACAHLPTVIGSLDLGNNDTLGLGGLTDLQSKHVLRLTLDLGVQRARDKNGVPKEVHSNTYKARRDSLLLSCPNIWTVNDVFTTGEERATLRTKRAEPAGAGGDRAANEIAVTATRNKDGTQSDYSLLVQLANDGWNSRISSKKETAVLSAEHSFSAKHKFDTDAFQLAILLDDYLEEARIANAKGVAYHGIRGTKYPTIHAGRILQLDRRKKLDFAALMSAWIRAYIPKNLYTESLQSVIGDTFTHMEIKDIVNLPEFACTAMVCLLRRLVLREIDALNGDSDDFSAILGSENGVSTQFVRGITVEAQYDYEFHHLTAVMQTLRKTDADGPGGKSKSKSPTPKNKGKVQVTTQEILQITVLPDIVTSSIPEVLEIERVNAHGELLWTTLLSSSVLDIVNATLAFRNNNTKSSEDMGNKHVSLDQSMMVSNSRSTGNLQALQGIEEEGKDVQNEYEDGLGSLSVSEESNTTSKGGPGSSQAEAPGSSFTTSKKVVVSIMNSLDFGSHEQLNDHDGVSAHGSLNLTVGSDIMSPQTSVMATETENDIDDNFSSNLERQERESALRANRKEETERIPKYIPTVTSCVADRVTSPTFALVPVKEIIAERGSSPLGVALLSEAPVFVQAHQLPKLEADSVSVDKLFHASEERPENFSVASMSTVESTMSMATAARTMLAEMGTLRNIRNMHNKNSASTQKMVDTTTWKPSYEVQRRTGSAPAGASRHASQPLMDSATWFAGLAQSNALDIQEQPASIGAYLEKTWKEQVAAENYEAAKEVEKTRLVDTPANLKPHLVTGVTKTLLTAISPIDKLKMKTRYTKINTHTVDAHNSPGEVMFAEKTPDGRPLSSTWYPVKDKREYVISNAINQNPLEAVTQSTALWSEREIQGIPTSRGGGFTVRPSESTTRARTAGSLSRRPGVSKVINGHNEDFWPLNKRDAASQAQRSLQDTSDIVLSSVELDFGQSSMAEKIALDKKMRPSSRGPLAAATKNLHLNSGFKMKFANGAKYPPVVKPLSKYGSSNAEFSALNTQGNKVRLSSSPR